MTGKLTRLVNRPSLVNKPQRWTVPDVDQVEGELRFDGQRLFLHSPTSSAFRVCLKIAKQGEKDERR